MTMDNIQDSSLSAPSDFTENMTMYMAEDFDIARWRKERKMNKQNSKAVANQPASIAAKEIKDVNSQEDARSKIDTIDAIPDASPPEEHDEDEGSESASSVSDKSSSRHPTSTLDLPGFAWPISAEATQETNKSQQMLTEIQDLQFQVEQKTSENTLLKEENNRFRAEISQLRKQKTSENALLKEENDKFRAEISQLRDHFSELADQLAEFQIEYDALQKERHSIAKVLMQEWGMKEKGRVKNGSGREGVGFKYT